MMPPVFASWSGGKDSCLACYRALNSGLQVRYLANMVTGDGTRSRSHGILAAVLRVQSHAIGIPILQRRTTRDTYEVEFKDMLRAFKQEGIEGGIFGDIDFNEHRAWIERVCQAAGITPHLPLWAESQDKLLREFVELGFKSVVIAAKADLFGEDVLGCTVDMSFIQLVEELRETKGVTPSGEAGEYHTLVVDGPLFQKRIEIIEAEKVMRDGIRFLEITGTELTDK